MSNNEPVEENKEVENSAENIVDTPTQKPVEKPVESEHGFSLSKLAKSLASLKITVTMFSFGLFLVLVGTLAQRVMDINGVLKHYFRCWWAKVDVTGLFWPEPSGGWEKANYVGKVVFCEFMLLVILTGLAAYFIITSAKSAKVKNFLFALVAVANLVFLGYILSRGETPKFFYFPGGFIIGGILFINLVCAHASTFKIRVKGQRRNYGIGLLLLGLVMLFLVCTGAFTQEVAATTDAAFWRVVWRLLRGGLIAVILYGACLFLFRKRAGVVLLHGGIGLLLVSEVWTHNLAVEANMTIVEGETVNYVDLSDKFELAIIDDSGDMNKIIKVPHTIMMNDYLITQADFGEVQEGTLPFDIKVIKYMKNSNYKQAPSAIENVTWGVMNGGSKVPVQAYEVPEENGTTSRSNYPAVEMELFEKGTSNSLGKYVFSRFHYTNSVNRMQRNVYRSVKIGDKEYKLLFRNAREYLKDKKGVPFEVQLKDFSQENYMGTQNARDYSSLIQLKNGQNLDRFVHIWMNNPLRFSGRTFYQSGVLPMQKGTILQVVKNSGWMLPYICCMLIAVGMMGHFGIIFYAFVRKMMSKNNKVKVSIFSKAFYTGPNIVAIAALLLTLAFFGRLAKPPVDKGEMKLVEFSKLPVVHGGRLKPFDTLARSYLTVFSEKATLKDENGHKHSAVKWLLDVICKPPVAYKHKVFRIHNLQLLKNLGLTHRSGYRYSLEEFYENALKPVDHKGQKVPFLMSEYDNFKDKDRDDYTAYEGAVRKLLGHMNMYMTLRQSFTDRSLQTREEFQRYRKELEALKEKSPIRVFPSENVDEDNWEIYAETSLNYHYLEGPKKLFGPFSKMLSAYADGDAAGFNSNLKDYNDVLDSMKKERRELIEKQLKDLDERRIKAKEITDSDERKNEETAIHVEERRLGREKQKWMSSINKTGFEVNYNKFSPFFYCAQFYLLSLVFSLFSWLFYRNYLNKLSIGINLAIFLVHSYALGGRIYMTGYSPVTDLYSSAIFIGWGVVIGCLFLESIFRNGLLNAIASIAGYSTLLIGHFLSLEGSGDTMEMMRAVLDTKFWLWTHVTCITLGYSACFLAGLIAIIYLFQIMIRPEMDKEKEKNFKRLIYGVICFASLLSFVGTILGGLWADDSWGRFWGWDPKENGALKIVIWNAIILHCLWGRMVGTRGLAVLAVFGNVVTAWSWFGVNELGIGLHSYGFTEGKRFWITFFAITQVLIMVAALISKFVWQYKRSADPKSKIRNSSVDRAGMALSAILIVFIVYICVKIDMVDTLPDRVKDLKEFYSSR